MNWNAKLLASVALLLLAQRLISAHADPNSAVCRAFVVKTLATPAALATLKGQGFQVQLTDGIPTQTQMNQLFDLGIAFDKMGKVSYWMVIAGGSFSQKIAPILNADFSDVPKCAWLPTFGAAAYFNTVIGEEARARLDRFYGKGTLDSGLGDLILKAETVRFYGLTEYSTKYKDVKTRYDKLVREVKRAWDESSTTDTLKKLDEVRRVLFPYYKRYLKTATAMSLLLDPNGFGNCQSNTQLILATLIDAGVNVGPAYQLGAQLFEDHIQPVVIEKKTQRIFDLTSGLLSLPDAPIYSPELITFALARSAGRAMSSEREFALLIKKMNFFSMNVGLATNYYVLDRRDQPLAAWKPFNYLRFDRSFSFVSASSSGGEVGGPVLDLMTFSALSASPATQARGKDFDKAQSPHASSELLGDLKEFAKSTDRQNLGKFLKGSFAAAKRALGGIKVAKIGSGTYNMDDFELGPEGLPLNGNGPSTRSANFADQAANYPSDEELEILNQKYWRLIPPANRPPFEMQKWVTRQALETTPGNKVRGFKMSAQYALSPDDLSSAEIADDMDFAIVPETTALPEEDVQTHAGPVHISYPTSKVIYRRQFESDPAIRKAYEDDVELHQWMESSFEKTVAHRTENLALPALATATEKRDGVLGIPALQLDRISTAVAAYLELKTIEQKSEALPMGRLNSVLQLKSAQACAVSVNVMNLAYQFFKKSADTVKWLDGLDPESRQRFFEFYIVWKSLYKTLDGACINDLPAEVRDYTQLQGPLDALLSYVVYQVIRQGEVNVIPPQFISEVSLIPTMETVPPPPPARKAEKTTVGNSQVEVRGNSEKQGAEKLQIRTETLMSLVASVTENRARDPFAQIVMAKLWSDVAQKYFAQAWIKSEPAKANFVNIWTWSPFVDLRDWMEDSVLALADQVHVIPGHYVRFKDLPMTAFTRVPTYVWPDLKAALAERHLTIEEADTMPPVRVANANFRTMKEMGQLTDSSCYDASYYGDINEDTSKQIQTDRVVRKDYLSYTWKQGLDCGNEKNRLPFQSTMSDKITAKDQMVRATSYSLELTDKDPGLYKINKATLEESVGQALDEEKQ